MATYNGDAFLAAQIDSILAQSYPNWRLVIHDDGSSDSTVKLVGDYVARFPERIVMLDDGVVCGGAKNNFAHLMAHASADYIMFADQDDVWLPGKIKDSLVLLLKDEATQGKQAPLAVFTDLAVVDEQLNSIAPSFWAFQNLRPGQLACSIHNLAVRNCITGCTLLMNRSALAVCVPILPVAVMHDWWCGLKILQAGGKLIPLNVPTVLYRQHEDNAVGATQWTPMAVLQKVLRFRQHRKDLMANYAMARYFLCYGNFFSFCIKKIVVMIR